MTLNITNLIHTLNINVECKEGKPNFDKDKLTGLVKETLLSAVVGFANSQDNANTPKEGKNQSGYAKSSFVGPDQFLPKR